jgi:hypothetical protein
LKKDKEEAKNKRKSDKLLKTDEEFVDDKERKEKNAKDGKDAKRIKGE